MGKSAGKGSPELGACGRGTLCMCQETCLSAVSSAGKGSPEFEASDRGKKAVCQETRLSAAQIVVEVRRLLRCLSATPEGVLNLAKEAFATRRQLEPR